MDLEGEGSGGGMILLRMKERDDFLPNGSYDDAAVKQVALGLGIPFALLWVIITPLLLLLVIKGCGREGRHDRQFIRKTPVAITVGILWLLIEFFQTNWFTFATEVEWPGRGFLTFLNAFQLNFPLSWDIWFWIFSSYAFFVLLLTFIFMCCCVFGETTIILAGSLFLTMIPIFQPLMLKMMEALVCTYPVGETAYLEIFPSILCWQGIHILYVTVSGFVILVFYPSISITMASLVGGRSDKTVWLSFLVIQFRILQVFLFAFFKDYHIPVLLALGGINLSFLLLVLLIPNTNAYLKAARDVAMCMAIWAVICTLISVGINDPTSWLSTGLLIGGWIIIPIIGIAVFYYLKNKREKPKEVPLTPPPATIPNQYQPPPVPRPTSQVVTEINISQTQSMGPNGQMSQSNLVSGTYGDDVRINTGPPQNQPNPAQPYPTQPYPTQPYPGQPYPTQPYPHQYPPDDSIPNVIGVPQVQPAYPVNN